MAESCYAFLKYYYLCFRKFLRQADFGNIIFPPNFTTQICATLYSSTVLRLELAFVDSPCFPWNYIFYLPSFEICVFICLTHIHFRGTRESQMSKFAIYIVCVDRQIDTKTHANTPILHITYNHHLYLI